MLKMAKSEIKEKHMDKEVGKVEGEPYNYPMICLFDFEKDVEEELKKLRFKYIKASFGSTVIVNNNQYQPKLLRTNHYYPSNLYP